MFEPADGSYIQPKNRWNYRELKFKRVRASLRKVPHVELLEPRVLYSADVFFSLGLSPTIAAEDSAGDPDWPQHGGQSTALPVAKSTPANFNQTVSVAEFEIGELNSLPQPGEPDEATVGELNSHDSCLLYTSPSPRD